MKVAMRIRRIPIERVNPAPYNPRADLRPGDPEYTKLERSLDEFGLVEPLVWNSRTGHLVGGHQRLKVLIARGDTAVDVSVVDLPSERERALNLALNKVSGSWDEEKLASLLDELTRLPDFDVAIAGFDMGEVEDLLTDFGYRAEEEEGFDLEAELAKIGDPVTKPGDLIELGAHRLLCGDCTDTEQVRRLMDGERAVLFATDPPYLVGYDGTNHPTTSKRRKKAGRSRGSGPGKRPPDGNKDWSGTYAVTWDDAEEQSELYERFIGAAVGEAVRGDAAWYCWHASRRQAMLEAVWERFGAFVHGQIIWAKNRSVLTRSWYSWAHEPCLFGWKRGSKPPRRSRDILSTVWRFDTLPNGPERPDHPTPKPIGLFEIPMRQHTLPGEVCYEPFAGSGTQVIAAERLGRRCFAMEISPVYCDLIVRRWLALVGPDRAPGELAQRYAAVTEEPAL